MIKILCVSDTIDPLVYSTNIRKRYNDIDIVLAAGDLPMNYLGFIASSLNCPLLFVFGNHNLARYETFKHRHRDTPNDPLDRQWGGAEPAAERGSNSYLKRTFGSTYIGDKTTRVRNILFAGLGGSIRYNNGKNQYTDFQMYYKIIRLMPRLLMNKLLYGRFVDILLTHAAPREINDLDDPCHRGFRAFLWFIKLFRPRYVVHGHIHLYDSNTERVSHYLGAEVINVYGRYVLRLED